MTSAIELLIKHHEHHHQGMIIDAVGNKQALAELNRLRADLATAIQRGDTYRARAQAMRRQVGLWRKATRVLDDKLYETLAERDMLSQKLGFAINDEDLRP